MSVEARVGNDSDIYVYNSTFVSNNCNSSGGGMSSAGPGYYTYIVSSVFAGNIAGNAGSTSGTGLSFTNTVYEGTMSIASDLGGNISTNDAGVDMTLADNGGSTKTHALIYGGVSIDAGSNDGGMTYDQRGIGYARTFGSATDVGAYEYMVATGTIFKFK